MTHEAKSQEIVTQSVRPLSTDSGHGKDESGKSEDESQALLEMRFKP